MPAPTCTSPRRAPYKMNYLESDSSNEDKSNENALLDDQDRDNRKISIIFSLVSCCNSFNNPRMTQLLVSSSREAIT